MNNNYNNFDNGNFNNNNNNNNNYPYDVNGTLNNVVNLLNQSVTLQANSDRQIGIIASQVNGLMGDMNMVKDEIERIKYNEEIETEKVDVITRTAKRRAYEIVGNDPLNQEKYYRRFLSKCYSDAKSLGLLGSRISRTRKGNYQAVLNFIEAWEPKQGRIKFMQEIDEKVRAKNKARELGY